MAHGIEVKNHFVIDILTGDDIARHHLRQLRERYELKRMCRARNTADTSK